MMVAIILVAMKYIVRLLLVEVHTGRSTNLLLNNADWKKETVEIEMEFEPDNPRDKNAIRFDALWDGVCHPLWHVGRNKIPKLTTAIKNNELRSTVLTMVRGSYVYPIDKLMWTGYFAVTKLKKWLPDASENTYNALLKLICFRKYLLVFVFCQPLATCR